MFSVIIPTIWSSESIFPLIDSLCKCSCIGEIILINNKSNISHIFDSNKIREFVFASNQYVNPSWNFGVLESKYPYICLLNDDIEIDIEAFHYMDGILESLDGVVGISKSCYIDRSSYYIEKISVRNRGWGCAIFLKKENYYTIPDDLRIWFGDDWLIKMNPDRVFRLNGPKIVTKMSESSEVPEFKIVIDQDVANSIKYELPWSNDY